MQSRKQNATQRIPISFLLVEKMNDFKTICDQILNEEDVNVQGWRQLQHLFVIVTEQLCKLSGEYEVYVTCILA